MLESCFDESGCDQFTAEQDHSQVTDMYDLHDEEQRENTPYLFSGNYLEGSIQLHDYCVPVKSTVRSVNKCEQTNVIPYMSYDKLDIFYARPFSEVSTQTCATTCLSKLIQTEPTDVCVQKT